MSPTLVVVLAVVSQLAVLGLGQSTNVPPGGSWLNSCDNTIWDGLTLTASCAFQVRNRQLQNVPPGAVGLFSGVAVGEEHAGVEYVVFGLAAKQFGAFTSKYIAQIGSAGTRKLIKFVLDKAIAPGFAEPAGAAADAAADVALDVAGDTVFDLADTASMALDLIPGIGQAAAIAAVMAVAFTALSNVIVGAEYTTGYISSSLNVAAACGGYPVTLSNNNGILACDVFNANVPGGSWRNSCTGSSLNGTVLTALCNAGVYYNDNGVIVSVQNYSSIETSMCAQPTNIVNNGGRLQCSGGIVNGGIPVGSWASSCAPMTFSNNVLSAYCGLPGPPSRINLNMCSSPYSLSNDHGKLICSPAANSPGGSWSSTCSPWDNSNGVLSAYCGQTYSNGTARLSSFTTAKCLSGNLINSNSVLTCDGAIYGLPLGTWTGTCVTRVFNSELLLARCSKEDAANGRITSYPTPINFGLCAAGATLKAYMPGSLLPALVCSTPSATLPGGNWANTCGPLSWNADTGALLAYCGQVGVFESPAVAALNTALCATPLDIDNDNGVLVCRPNLSAAVALPLGTWTSTCSPVSWDSTSGILTALCGKPANQLSMINTLLCQAPASISNDFGTLLCSDPSPALPGGSFYSSCAPLRYEGTTLWVQCSSGNAAAYSTSLDVSLCAGTADGHNGISNNHGYLECYPSDTLPGGDWKHSCTASSWSGGVLAAACGLPNNRASVINYDLCQVGATLDNDDHKLVCSAAAPGIPVGSWYETCSPSTWDGNTLSAYCGLTDNAGTPILTSLAASLCSASTGMYNQGGNLACNNIAIGLPGGDWAGSCLVSSWDGQWLTAYCGYANGVMSNINYALCDPSDGVQNTFNTLTCTPLAMLGMPGKSWIGSCSPLSWNSYTLTAQCGHSPNSITSSLNPWSCNHINEVSNNHGYLAC